jgi:hypothetical protein
VSNRVRIKLDPYFSVDAFVRKITRRSKSRKSDGHQVSATNLQNQRIERQDIQATAQWPSSELCHWMQNGSADLAWHGGSGLPVTTSVRPRGPHTSYITSLRSGWFDYAAEEIAGKALPAWGFRCAGQIARMLGIDNIILVGNAPVSTNIWTERHIPEVPLLCQQIASSHKNHFIGVRNLQADKHGPLIDRLKNERFYAIPARIVYEFDFRETLEKKHSHLQRDRSALKRSGLQVNVLTSISPTQAAHLRDLYQAIYIDKHSALNAQYTAQFFADMLSFKVMTALVVQDADGRIVAFAMLYAVDDTLTVPALGYDARSSISGLYRLLFAAISLHAQEKRMLLNYSSGAGDFKRKRGGVARLEYTLLKAPQHWHSARSSILSLIQRYGQDIREIDLIAWGA